MSRLADEPIVIRPVRDSDGPGLAAAVDLCTAEDVRIRFCGGMRHLSPELTAQLIRTDGDRDVGLVAEDVTGNILGAARLSCDPQGETGEYSILVRSDRQGRGLGGRLLEAILHHAAAHGVREVWGDVARDNGHMLELADALGFRREAAEDPCRFRLVWTSPRA